MKDPELTRVLIVEDEPPLADLLQATLSGFSHIEVVGTAASGLDALRLVSEKVPDVVLIDIELGGEPDGIRAANLIKSANPAVAIVILSTSTRAEYLAGNPESQAAGMSCMLRQGLEGRTTLTAAIEDAARGLASKDRSIVHAARTRRRPVIERLTSEQLLILQNVASGHTDRAIAREFGIEEDDARRLVCQVYEDLGIAPDAGVDPRVRATLIYLEESLTKPNAP